MVSLYDFANQLVKKKNTQQNLNVEQKAQIDIGVSRAHRKIEEVVTLLQKNPP